MEIPLLPCPIKYVFHIDCPGCGLQRSIIALFKGNLMESLSLYPATIPIFALLIYTALHLKFDFKQGAAVIQWSYIGCTAVIVGFYIYKIVTHKLI
jgi:hypothetical protein